MDNQENHLAIPPGEILGIEIVGSKSPFVKGNKLGRNGRTVGALDRATRRMKVELAEHFERTGEEGNLLLILARIAADPKENSKIRCMAADKCLRYLAPRLLSVSTDGPEPEDQERQTVVVLQAIREMVSGIDPKKLPAGGSS